ncbi:2,4-dichlorophenol 6-monooxygenase [Aspergillus californicus]
MAHTPTTDTIETDVLIVGAGVTGLTLSILLADYGVKALTVAKHRDTAPSPRAHITNQRTVEVFRDMGIEEAMHAVSTPLTSLGNCVMGTSMTGREIARYSCYGAGADQLSDFARASPCGMINTPQNELEKVLLTRAYEKKADIRFSTEVVCIQQDGTGVLATVRERLTGAGYQVRAKYAYGADGGRSVVAEQLGFTFQGEPALMNMMTCWLEVDLTEYTAHRPACMYWMLRPGNAFWVGSGTFITVKPFTEWLLNRQYDPADGEPDMSEAGVISYARSLIGIPDVEVRVKDISKWQVNKMVADEYRHGRVLLGGDAAHRHPPASGLGSNTCVQDAYNIAWKLALVLSGRASDALLDSYSQERQPVGKQIVDSAIQALYNMARLPGVLGFQPGQSQEEGYKSLEALASDEPGAEKRRAELDEAVNLQNRRSNALGVQLGQRYRDSCAVAYDGTPFPEYRRDPTLYYEPTTHPGAYLPHAWVEHKGCRLSTLNVLKYGSFGLIVGVGGAPFQQAAEVVSKEFGLEIPVYAIGYRCLYDDVLREWSARSEISDRGALLVRPDRFIAWRSFNRPSDPTDALRSAVRHILSR